MIYAILIYAAMQHVASFCLLAHALGRFGSIANIQNPFGRRAVILHAMFVTPAVALGYFLKDGFKGAREVFSDSYEDALKEW